MFKEDKHFSQMGTDLPLQQQRFLPLEEFRRAIYDIAQGNSRQIIIINAAYASVEDPINHMFMTIQENVTIAELTKCRRKMS